MSKNRRKAEEENRRRFEVHAHAKGVATKAANHQRQVQLGRELANGLHPVRMDSIADSLDEVDPKVRGMAVTHHPAPPAFVPPQFQPSLVREKAMTAASYVSHERVQFKSSGTPAGPGRRGTGKTRSFRVKLPQDVVRRIGERIEGVEFECEINDDGILFRPADRASSTVSLPSWVPLKK